MPVNPIVKGSELIVSDQAVRIAQPSAIPSGDDTVKAASKGNQTVTEEPSNLWEGYTSQLASIHADHDRVSRPVEDGETESQPTQRAMGQHAVTLEGNVRTSQSMQPLAAITFPDILAGIKTKLDRLSDELGREMGRLGITDGIHHQIPGAVDRVLEGVGSCVANVAETVQQASIMSRRAADATCRLNTSQLENAFSGAKGVIENLGGFLQSSIDRGFISEPQRELREAHAGAQAPRSVVPQVHQDPASLLDDPIPRFHSQTLAPASNGGEIQTTQITAALVEARGHSDGSRSFSRRQRPQTVGNHVTFARSHDASIPLRHPLRSAPRIASVNCGGPARGRCQIPGAWPPSAERTTAIPSVVQGSESPKVEQCTMQLLEMGFAGEAAAGIDQLRFFAKEADGDIEKAIDMLNEEQGCWSEMRQRHT